MFITVLSSTTLYLNLTININNETDLAKSYYILSLYLKYFVNSGCQWKKPQIGYLLVRLNIYDYPE